MTTIQVKKRDGALEPWNYDKVLNSIAKAGLSVEEAERLAFLVEKWAEKNAKDNTIVSLDVRDKVIEVLKALDPVSASIFEAYRK